ncbi:MAG: hypothetical protein ACYTGP_04465 [Planctomycetota bacterium]|jgi:hypothetical protein
MSHAKQPTQTAEGPSKVRLFVTVGLIVVVVGAIATFGLWKPSSGTNADPGTATPVATPTPTATPAQPGLPTAGTPAPNEYDAANNRHWNAAHGHWHPGPPPNASGNFGDATLLNSGAQTPSAPAPGQPAPYEYDEENNRHWDPGHGHWHPGPPPTPPSGTPTTPGQP